MRKTSTRVTAKEFVQDMFANMDYADACGQPVPDRTAEMREKLKNVMTQQYLRQFGKNTLSGPPQISELINFAGLIDYKKLA
jgi:hypothetical protein